MKRFVKLSFTVLSVSGAVAIYTQWAVISGLYTQLAASAGFRDEIYHWNATEAWDQSAGDRGLSEAGNFIERYFPLLELTVRAKKKLDGSLLAAAYFHDDCEVGATVTTQVYDYRGEPFELFCTSFSGKVGWRVGARLLDETSTWFETYGKYSVRLRFADWDFSILEKYARALEL